MSYSYTNGDGLSVLDKTKPNGATEQVAILDDSIRQIKAYLRDDVAGVAKIVADITDLQASINNISSGYYFAAYNSAAQTIAAGAGATLLTMNQAPVNPQSGFSIVTGKFTVPKAGWWTMHASAKFALAASSSPTGIVHKLGLFINNAEQTEMSVARGTDTSDLWIRFSEPHYLALNDVVDLRYTLTVASGSLSVTTSTEYKNLGFRGTRTSG